MRHFIYDEHERRLVLVDGLYPSLNVLGANYANDGKTPNSSQERIYNALYIWEDVEVYGPHSPYKDGETYTDYHVKFIEEHGKNNEKKRLIMIIPYADCYMLFAGAYTFKL